MKKLTEADVIRVMREEWHARLAEINEQIDISLNSKVDGGDKEPVIAPELKVRHKDSGIRYTVCSVSPRDVILRTPEGEKFLVSKEDLEASYELD